MNTNPEKKSKSDSIRIVCTMKSDLKDRLMQQAQKENRSMSNLIVKIVTDYLNAQK